MATREETKLRLRATLQLELLAFKPILLVVSTRGRDVSVLTCSPSRFTGRSGSWYYVDAYDTATYTDQEWKFVSHDALAYINAGEKEWRIPRDMCVPDPQSALKFSYYQFDPDFEDLIPTVTITEIQTAFDARCALIVWFNAERAFQESRDMSVELRAYAAVSDEYNLLDEIAYFLCARILPDVPDATDLWLKGETKLLIHKMLLRPQLHSEVCKVAEAVPSLTMACLSARKFHRIRLEQIARRPAKPISQDLRDTTLKFLNELISRVKRQDEDIDAISAVSHIVSPPPRMSPVTVDESMQLADIRGCAPECMQRLMAKALGTTRQRAEFAGPGRRTLNHFLLEAGFDSTEVEALSRPRIMVEYELERPLMPWSEVQDSIRQAEAERIASINDTANPKHNRSCYDIMRDGLCPHQPPVAANQPRLSLDDFKLRNRTRSIRAHTLCHTQLQRTWQSRKDSNQSCGEKVKTAWTNSPWNYTVVAFKGEKFNVDKKAEIKAKRKATLSVKNLLSASTKQQEKEHKKKKRKTITKAEAEASDDQEE
jgi:hypothetical protein